MDSVPNDTTQSGNASVVPQTQIATANFSSAQNAVPIKPAEPPPPPPQPMQPPPPPPSAPPPAPEKKLAEFPGHKGLVIKILLAVVGVATVLGALLFFFLPDAVRQDEPVTLTYWGVMEDSNTMKELIRDFEKDHPMIKVEYLQQDQKQYLEKLTTRIQNGSGPDIYRFHNSWTGMLSPLLLPLPSTVIKTSEFKEQYFPVVQKDLTYKGAIYGVPMGFDTLVLFTSSELFKAAGASVPTTWNDFVETARSLTVKAEGGRISTAGAALGNTDNVAHAGDILSLLFIQNGANLLELGASQQDVAEALQFYVNFQPEVWNGTLDPSLLAFSKGNLAMYLGYSWDIFAIKAQNPGLSFEVHPVPSLADRKMTIASYWVEGASSASPHKKEALLFLSFLAKKETQKKFYEIASKTRLFGEPYARRDLAESLKTNTLVAPFVNQGDVAQSSYFISDIAETGINADLNAALSEAIKGINTTFTPVDTAAGTLTGKVDGALREYGL